MYLDAVPSHAWNRWRYHYPQTAFPYEVESFIFDETMFCGNGMMERMHRGSVWSINGIFVPGGEHTHAPLLTLERDRSYIFDMFNDTAWWHPMHLHGHVFRVVSRKGEPTSQREWLDTVLMAPGERVEIAFVADNPGDWMFHCHILEHQQAGMMGTVKVV